MNSIPMSHRSCSLLLAIAALGIFPYRPAPPLPVGLPISSAGNVHGRFRRPKRRNNDHLAGAWKGDGVVPDFESRQMRRARQRAEAKAGAAS